MAAINLDNYDQFEDFMDRFDTIVTDCDGVLYINNDPINGVVRALNSMRKFGKKVVFATNNSTKNRIQCLQKLQKMGYDAEIDEVFPTSYA